MLRLEPANAAAGKGHRLTDYPRSPWVMGEGDPDALFAGATWTRHEHKLGWFKRFAILQATPAEMVLVRGFLRDAHRMLGADKLVVALPCRDTIVAADHARLAQLMAIATLRYTEVPAEEKLTADLLVVEDGAVVGMVLNTLLETELPAEAKLDRALRLGPDGEFHLTAGTDVESLFELAEVVVDFVVDRWAPDSTFSGTSKVVITASDEALVTAIGEYLTDLAAKTGIEQLRFPVQHVPR